MKRVLQLLVIIITISVCYWVSLPLIGEIHLFIGDAYLEKNHLYIAMDYYRKGISYDSVNPELYNQLALSYLNLSQREKNSSRKRELMEKAMDTFKKAVPLTGNPRLDYNLGLVYELKGDTAGAQRYFKQAYGKSSGHIGGNKIK